MITIDFTYDVVTPESAEHGDFAESGFIAPGMWKYPDLEEYERNEWAIGDLAYLIKFAKSLGITCSDGGNFYSVDPDINFRTGESTTYGMHIDGVTDATVERIARLLD
jgi:hypothetical protein